MKKRCAGAVPSSLRILEGESDHVDGWRDRWKKALPTGSHRTLHTRTGIPLTTIGDAIEGRHVRLPLLLAIEGLREIRAEVRRDLADELLEPLDLAAIHRPGAHRGASGVLGANGDLLAAVAGVEREIGAGLEDGILDQQETLRVVATLAETRARLDALLYTLTGGPR